MTASCSRFASLLPCPVALAISAGLGAITYAAFHECPEPGGVASGPVARSDARLASELRAMLREQERAVGWFRDAGVVAPAGLAGEFDGAMRDLDGVAMGLGEVLGGRGLEP